jgi:hypothetical protein
MADADPTASLNSGECREPTLEDLVKLARALNETGAQYVIVGGFAMRAAGYTRNTMDVDIVVETSAANEARVIQALMILPDQAVREVNPGDVAEYGVVRVADDILVDLMKSGCGVDYHEAIRDAVFHEVEGVRIPFASPQTLWRMKQTHREKDIPDRMFLRQWLTARGIPIAEKPSTPPEDLQGWLNRTFGGSP